MSEVRAQTDHSHRCWRTGLAGGLLTVSIVSYPDAARKTAVHALYCGRAYQVLKSSACLAVPRIGQHHWYPTSCVQTFCTKDWGCGTSLNVVTGFALLDVFA